MDVPKEDIEWLLSFLEPDFRNEEVVMSEEDQQRLDEATAAFAKYAGRERRRIDGELHRLIKLRKKALNALPEDLQELVRSLLCSDIYRRTRELMHGVLLCVGWCVGDVRVLRHFRLCAR